MIELRGVLETAPELLAGLGSGCGCKTADSINALEVLAECGIITPVYQDGTFYTDADGAIYVL